MAPCPLQLEVVVERARLHDLRVDALGRLAAVCCSPARVQLKVGFGVARALFRSPAVAVKAGQDFSLAGAAAVPAPEPLWEPLRVELWASRAARADRALGVAAVPWLLLAGQAELGQPRSVEVGVWSAGGAAVGTLHLRLRLTPAAPQAVARWPARLAAELRRMCLDSCEARCRQDGNLLLGPACAAGHRMAALAGRGSNIEAYSCQFCGARAREPREEWRVEGAAPTADKVYVDTFWACSQCRGPRGDLLMTCYCPHCARELGAGRAPVGVEASKEDMELLVKASHGSDEPARVVAERLWRAYETHRAVDRARASTARPLAGGSVADLGRAADEAPEEAGLLPGAGELDSWGADGRRLSAKIAAQVRAGTPGVGALVRAATRATLRGAALSQKTSGEDALRLASELEDAGGCPAAVRELALAVLARHGSLEHYYPSIAEQLGSLWRAGPPAGPVAEGLLRQASERVHSYIFEKLGAGTKWPQVDVWLHLASIAGHAGMEAGLFDSKWPGAVEVESLQARARELLLRMAPMPLEEEILRLLSGNRRDGRKCLGVLRFLSASGRTIHQMYWALDNANEGEGERALLPICSLLGSLPELVGGRWLSVLGGLPWPDDPRAEE